MTSVDWSKYGIKDSAHGKAQDNNSTSVDWSKYGTSQPKQSAPYKQSMQDLQRNADRADINLSPVESSKLRAKLPEVKQKPTVADRMKNDPIARAFGAVDNLGMRFENKVVDWLGLGRGLAKSNPKLQEQSPQFLKDANAPIYQEPTTTAQKTADVAGELASYIQPTKAVYKILEKTGLKKAGPVLGKILTGAAAQAGVQTAKEAGAAVSGLDSKTLGQRALDVGLAGGLGGAGEAAVPLVKAGSKAFMNSKLGQAFTSYLQRGKVEVLPPQSPTLALPAPSNRVGNLNRSVTPDVINIPETGPRALPAPNIAPPTTGRLERISAKNPYLTKLENLFAVAKQQDLPPGREYEYLHDLWSRMAGKEDPGLNELIDLASQTKPSKITPDLMERARIGQGKRDVYGVPLPAKTMAERYNGGVVAPAAMPETQIMHMRVPTSRELANARKGVMRSDNPAASEVAAAREPMAVTPAAQNATDPLANSDEWKNKWKLSMKRETMTRNFEDIMGKDAPKMQETYLDPIKQAEAARQRFIKAEKSQIKDLGIKFKSKEDQLVQKYGEGLVTLDDLKKETPNWQKVVDATDTFRKKYDEFLTKANEVLVNNGYSPIPKRDNYFPHYQEVNNLLSKVGIKLENTNLPTDINGLSADFKPGKNFFAHALQRKGNQTTYGALQGFDKYIEGISKLIHHTDNIKRLRGLDKAIRQKYEGETHLSDFVSELTDYTNNLAGKRSGLDRSAEELVGRKIYSAVDWARRQVSKNMVVGSVSSALSNTISLPQALATTGKKAFVEGMIDTLKNAVKRDGFAEKSRFLSARDTSLPLAAGKLQKGQEKAMFLFHVIDQFASQTVIRGKYNELISNGLKPEEAMKQADEYASRLMGDRSLGAAPTLFNSKTLGLFTQFQLEVNNQMSFLFKDLPRSMSKAKFASAITQVAVYDYLFNNLYEKVTGQRPAIDPIGIALNAYKDYKNQSLNKGQAGKNLSSNIMQTLPFASTFVGGRIPLQAALPNPSTIAGGIINGTEGWKDEAMKPLWYLASPFGGGQLKKTFTAAQDIGLLPGSKKALPGVYGKGAGGEYLKYPVSTDTANKIKGLAFGRTGFKETNNFYRNGAKNLSPQQTQKLEKSSNPKADYGIILKQREIDRLRTEATKIAKSVTLSNDEKKKKMEGLTKSYNQIVGR